MTTLSNDHRLESKALSIVLPTHNRAFTLKISIPSIINQSYSDWELIVIDDGSNDDTKKVIANFTKNDNRIRYHRNLCRQGQQKSKNDGISLSNNSLIFIAEDDVILDKNCLQTLVETYGEISSTQKSSCFGAVGPRLIEENIMYHSPKIADVNKMTGYIYTNFGLDSEKVIEVPTLHACSLFDREVFKKVGGFDENLYKGFAYREETDLYYRARRAGFHLFFQPKAIAYHLNSPKGGSHRDASRVKHGYFFFRNHVLFVTRFYQPQFLIMIPAFILFSFFVIRLPSKNPRW